MNVKTSFFQGCFLSTLIFWFIGCSSPDQFRIEGKFDNSKSKKVFLAEIMDRQILPIDSSSIGPDGSFKFITKPLHPQFYIVLSDALQSTVLGEKGTTVFLKADLRDTSGKYSLYGSDENKKLYDLTQNRVSSSNEMKNLVEESRKAKTASDTALIMTKAASIQSTFTGKVKSFIKENPNRFSSLYALNFLDPDRDFSSFLLVSENAGKKFKGNPLVDSLAQLVKDGLPTSVGQMAPEIKMPDPSGNYQSTLQRRGKYVLIDFWASWCGPCRRENPSNSKLYETYKNKGFTIYSVSLDKDKESWIKGIKEDNLSWTQVSDLKYWNSDVVRVFHFNSIPHNILLDPQGKIIAKNLHGVELEETLAKLFPSK